MKLKGLILAATLITGTASSLSAASLTWTGPSLGTWDTTTLNWSDGTSTLWPATSSLADSAIFNGASTTVTLSGNITANALNFDTTGYALTSGTLTLDGTTPTITTGTNVTATIGSIVAGSKGLATAGTGTLVLTGTNTYSGGTTIGSGSTLQVGNGGSTGVLGSGAVVNNGSLVYNQTGPISLPGAVIGTGSLSMTTTGAGTITVANNITLGGTISLTSGTTGATTIGSTTIQGSGITLGGGKINAAAWLSSNLVLDTSAANGDIHINAEVGTNYGTYSNLFNSMTVNSGTGTIYLAPPAAVNTTGLTDGYIGNRTNTFNGNVVLQNNVWFVAKYSNDGSWWNLYGSGATFNGDVNLGSNNLNGSLGTHSAWGAFPNTLTFAGAVTGTTGKLAGGASGIVFDLTNSPTHATTQNIGVTIADAMSAATSVTKQGAGTTTFTAANTYTGTTTVTGGTLSLANALALQKSTFTGGAGKLAFDSSVSGHAFTLGGLSGSSNLALADNAGAPNAVALTVGGNNASTAYSGILSGAGSFAKTGTGTLTLSGANTHTGGTAVNAGTLALASGGQILVGAGNVTIASGATLALSGTGTLKLDSATATIANDGTFSGTGNLDLGGLFNSYNNGNSGSYLLVAGLGTDSAALTVLTSSYDTNVWSSVTFNNGTLNFTAVPEPSTYGLLGAGALAGFAFVRRRRRRIA